MANNVAPVGFFTVPMKADAQTALNKRLAKFEKLPLLDQVRQKQGNTKKQRVNERYA